MKKALMSLLFVVLFSVQTIADWYYVDAIANTGTQVIPQGIKWSMLHFEVLGWKENPQHDSWDWTEGYLGRLPFITSSNHHLRSTGNWNAWLISGSKDVRDYNTGLWYRVSWGSAYRHNIFPTENSIILPVYFQITLLPL